MTTRMSATAGEILVDDFPQPMGLGQAVRAAAMAPQRKHFNQSDDDGRTVTGRTDRILAHVLSGAAAFWLSLGGRNGLLGTTHSPAERASIKRVRLPDHVARPPPRSAIRSRRMPVQAAIIWARAGINGRG